MVPADLHGFFEACGGVAGALIGLLFVAVSVTLDRLGAEESEQIHRIRASAALTAFTNALVISLFALIPGEMVGWTAVIVSIVGLMFVAASALSVLRVYRSDIASMRDALFLATMTVVFVLQLWQGVRVINHPLNSGAVKTIAVLVIVCFLIGIGRAWELIGGPEIGIRKEVRKVVRPKRPSDGDE
jgi:uncharacterized membrane protein YecN with MAPEG domain